MRSSPFLPLWCCIMLWPVTTSAQDWELIGLREYFGEIKQVYADTANDALYVCGHTSWLPDTGMSFYRLFQEDWDTIGLFSNQITSVINWQDTLIVCGGFDWINEDTIPNIAAWAGGQWFPFGTFAGGGGIGRLKIIDGNLYGIGGGGANTTIDGQPWHGIAKRVGGHWQPFPLFQNAVAIGIQDATIYNGHLVVVGAIHFAGDPYRNAMMLVDSTWVPIGPQGLIGSFSAGRACEVYNGDIYVSGSIPLLAGNAGHGIMRWDGSQWHDVGGGLTYLPNYYGVLCGATWMEVYDGKLFASGTFQYAGNVPAGGIAVWDGVQWCGLGQSLYACNSFDFLNDTLYANATIWQDTIFNTVVKYLRSDYADTCSVPVGVVEADRGKPRLTGWVDAQGLLNLSGVDVGNQHITVFDGLGRTLGDFRVTHSASLCRLLLPPLPSGVYIAHVHDQGSARFVID